MKAKARLKKGGKPSKIKSGIARVKTYVKAHGHKPVPGDAGLMSAKMVAYARNRREHRIAKTRRNAKN